MYFSSRVAESVDDSGASSQCALHHVMSSGAILQFLRNIPDSGLWTDRDTTFDQPQTPDPNARSKMTVLREFCLDFEFHV